MKLSHGIGLTMMGLLIGGGAWLGCGGDDTGGVTGSDAGRDGTTSGGDDSGGGGGGDSGGGGNDSGGGGDTGGGGVVSCETYCTQVMNNCKVTIPQSGAVDGGVAEYNSKDGCLAECARMKPGTINDQSGDTVGCRQYHSGTPAMTAPNVHCAHAGPSGGGVCSGGDGGAESRCVTFCGLMAKICLADAGTGVSVANQPFLSEAACLAACNTAPYQFSSNNAELITGDNSNQQPNTDDLNCRQYHLMAAYAGLDAGSANTHCPHLKINSATCK